MMKSGPLTYSARRQMYGFPHGGQAYPPHAASVSEPNILIRGLFAIFLCFHFPAFTYQLAMDTETGKWTGSAVLQAATMSSELFTFAMILASRDVRRLWIQCWPIWVPFGLAFLSVAWSYSAISTLQNSNTAMTTAFLGLALAGWFPGFQSVRFMIRVMTLGCALSIAWVIAFPDQAVHQQTDVFQFVHAGLWRGIFSHKQGLGYFAGLTTGLLFFYNTRIFPLPILVGAVACGLTCLIGTQSATGMVTAVLSPAILFIAYWITRFDPHLRRSLLTVSFIGGLVLYFAFQFGLLDFVVVQVLNKSSDLTGRTFFWQVIMQNFANSGRTLLGGGYGTGFAGHLYEMSVDNGYLDKVLDFGYLLSPVIFAIYGFIVWAGLKLVVRTPREQAYMNVFPLGIAIVIAIANIAESNFMTKSFGTVLTSIAVALIFQERRPAGVAPRSA